jgi:hypothetical protein
MIFPDGIACHFKTGAFRTISVNKWFELIPQLAKISADDKKNKGSIAAALSNLVGSGGCMSNQFIVDLIRISKFYEELSIL